MKFAFLNFSFLNYAFSRRSPVAHTNAHPTARPVSKSTPKPTSRPLRVVRIMESGQPRAHVGRMVISGRMADVCAELDRLAAREAAENLGSVALCAG
jgi:hypothetical protein